MLVCPRKNDLRVAGAREFLRECLIPVFLLYPFPFRPRYMIMAEYEVGVPYSDVWPMLTEIKHDSLLVGG